MRVAVDGRRLQDRPRGGVGRHTAAVVERLAHQFDLVVLANARRPRPDIDAPCALVNGPLGAPELVWLELGAGAWLRRNGGVFHGSFYAIPFSYPGPAALALFDLAPQRHPEEFGAIKRSAWRAYARRGAKRAKWLITASEHMRGEIAEHFGVDRSRIAVAPGAVEVGFSPARAAEAPDVLRRHGAGEDRYVIAMGGARRRALDVAVSAWQWARARSAEVPTQLVVVGREAPPDVPGVTWLGVVDDDEWAAALAGAEAFLYPSRYEGYGLPAHEAMAAGTPVVCAPVGSLEEVLGDAGVFCATPTPTEIGEGVVRLMADPDWARARRDVGLRRVAAMPTWDDTATVVAQIWESMGATRTQAREATPHQ